MSDHSIEALFHLPPRTLKALSFTRPDKLSMQKWLETLPAACFLLVFSPLLILKQYEMLHFIEAAYRQSLVVVFLLYLTFDQRKVVMKNGMLAEELE